MQTAISAFVVKTGYAHIVASCAHIYMRQDRLGKTAFTNRLFITHIAMFDVHIYTYQDRLGHAASAMVYL